ncbi:MAG TPA: glutamate formimidoyltransferase [Gemmatirosa sp.]|nr:glutamate formimidoyltransferase [Gemmatirosa sp.]
MRLVECVPNFSEGRDPSVVAAIREAIAAVPGATILDVTSDASHHRSVVTFVATPAAAVEAAFAGIATAAARIDLTRHAGVHPRVGATDVCPFVPLPRWGTTMDDCVALARALGARVGHDLGIPVFLYERAATRPDRVRLADVRRGGFEALRDALGRDPARAPDFGPARVHPTAGATIVGARAVLVAFNVFLGPAANVAVARAVARTVRESSGGLPHVRALGLEVDGQAQLSMNLVDHERTPLHVVYDAICRAAAAHGVEPTGSELIGLLPERALLDAGAHHVGLHGFTPSMLLERRIAEAVGSPEATLPFAARVAAPTPTPGGGSVAAHVAELAAALARMVAALTVGRPRFADRDAAMRAAFARGERLGTELQQLVVRDAAAYDAVLAARRLGEPSRGAALRAAWRHAAEAPLECARAAADVAELAAELAVGGNPTARPDAAVAALIADAACRAAALNVRVNVAAFPDPADGDGLRVAAGAHASRASEAAAAALRAAEPPAPPG